MHRRLLLSPAQLLKVLRHYYQTIESLSPRNTSQLKIALFNLQSGGFVFTYFLDFFSERPLIACRKRQKSSILEPVLSTEEASILFGNPLSDFFACKLENINDV